MQELINIHTAFSDILFDPKGHTYKSKKTNKRFVSATTKIKKVKQSFDSVYWTHYKALEANGVKVNPGMSLEQLKGKFKKVKNPSITPGVLANRWKKLAKDGQTVGTYVHARAEQYLLGKADLEHTGIDALLQKGSIPLIKQAEQYIKDHLNYVPIKTELIVGDYDSMTAGQCDALMFDTETNTYILIDWKTDKKLSLTNPYQNMKAPLERLEDSDYNKYALQLSIYRYCLEKNAGIKISKCIIINITLTNPTYVEYELPYLKKEVELLLSSKTNTTEHANAKQNNIYRPNFN